MGLPAEFQLATRFPLTLSETISVRQLRGHCKESADRYRGSVDIIYSGVYLDGLARKIFEDRGAQRTNIKEVHLYSFRSVGMHIDNMHSRSYLTFLIPILGKGELSHMIPNITGRPPRYRIAYQSIEPGFGYIFNDRKPHSFISESKCCFALIGSVSKRALHDYL